MNEIKAPLTKRIKDFIVAHIFAIGLILMGIMVLFSSCGKASAEEYNEYYTNWLLDKLENAPNYQEFVSTSGINSIIDDIEANASAMFRGECLPAYNNTAYVVGVEVQGGFGWLLDPFQNSSGYSGFSYEIGFNASNKRLQGRRMISSYNSAFAYIFAFDNVNGDILYCSKYVNTYQAESQFNLTAYDLNTGLNTSTGTKTIYWIPSNGKVNISMVYNNSISRNYAYRIPDYNMEVSDTNMVFASNENLNWTGYFTNEFSISPTFVEDSRLKMSIVNDAYGNKVLLTDIREFIDDFPIQDTSASSNELDNNTLIFTVVKDMMPETITLNVSNSNITDKYIFRTPLSVFNIDESDDVYISDVSFSISGSGQSVQPITESYNILTDFYLKQTNIRPSEEVIPKDTDVNGTKLTQVEYDSIKDKVNFSDGYYSPLGGGGNELIVPYGYNVLYITITGSRTIASIVNEMVTDSYLKVELPTNAFMDAVQLTAYLTSEIKKSLTGITSTDDAESIIRDYVKNNYYTNTFDIVVYYWAPDASLGEPDVMYYYLTESGRIRGISQILADMYKETNQISVNTKATYEYLYDKLNDFENMTLEAIWGDSPFSIFSSIDKLDNHLLTGVTQIIDAMPTYEPYNDSTVTSLLGDITTLLAEIINNQESPTDGYPNYISWVKEFDDLDGFGNWSDSVLDTFKNIYSFFNYRTDINIMETGIQTYITYVNDYVDMLLGNTESSLEIESRYYMSIFDGTYDINNINGGGN